MRKREEQREIGNSRVLAWSANQRGESATPALPMGQNSDLDFLLLFFCGGGAEEPSRRRERQRSNGAGPQWMLGTMAPAPQRIASHFAVSAWCSVRLDLGSAFVTRCGAAANCPAPCG